ICCRCGRKSAQQPSGLEPDSGQIIFEGTVVLHGAVICVLSDQNTFGIILAEYHGDAAVDGPVARITAYRAVGDNAGVRYVKAGFQGKGALIFVNAVDIDLAPVPVRAVEAGADTV